MRFVDFRYSCVYEARRAPPLTEVQRYGASNTACDRNTRRNNLRFLHGTATCTNKILTDSNCKVVKYVVFFYQWRSQDIADARAQHGHTTFVRTSVRGAEAFRGVWGLLPQKILEFYSLPGRF